MAIPPSSEIPPGVHHGPASAESAAFSAGSGRIDHSTTVHSATCVGQDGNPGANERVKVGIVGLGLRIRQFLNWPKEMYLQAVCDCKRRRLPRSSTGTRRRPPKRRRPRSTPTTAGCSNQQKLDGVFVTTPTHARPRPSLLALAAGMDVYAEKPFALTVQEGQLLVKAVRKYKRVFQVGTQARSLAINRWAVEQIHNGAIGKISQGGGAQLPLSAGLQAAGDGQAVPDRTRLGPVD